MHALRFQLFLNYILSLVFEVLSHHTSSHSQQALLQAGCVTLEASQPHPCRLMLAVSTGSSSSIVDEVRAGQRTQHRNGGPREVGGVFSGCSRAGVARAQCPGGVHITCVGVALRKFCPPPNSEVTCRLCCCRPAWRCQPTAGGPWRPPSSSPSGTRAAAVGVSAAPVMTWLAQTTTPQTTSSACSGATVASQCLKQLPQLACDSACLSLWRETRVVTPDPVAGQPPSPPACARAMSWQARAALK